MDPPNCSRVSFILFELGLNDVMLPGDDFSNSQLIIFSNYKLSYGILSLLQHLKLGRCFEILVQIYLVFAVILEVGIHVLSI